MALSGTLDTFELPDVLRLLASTAKTGRLRITGDRGSGSVWVDGGEIAATELLDGTNEERSDEEAVFGMLRFATGSFTFEGGAAAPSEATPRPIAPVLGAAEALLVEWRSIEAVVPSLDVWVALSPELPGPDVMIVADRWRAIAHIGSGAKVATVADALDLREMEGCRTVKELIELGLAGLIDEPAHGPAPAAEMFVDEIADPGADADEPAEPEFALEDESVEFEPESFGIEDEDLAADGEKMPVLAALDATGEVADPPEADTELEDMSAEVEEDAEVAVDAEPETGLYAEPETGLFAEADDADAYDAGDLDPAEMARQLANLSPKAAKAVAAAAKASTEAERDAALAAVEAEDDSVNRGLLLKFLGSVES